MEISTYELFEVPPRWVFLRLETDTGLIGWGEPIVEGHARTTVAAVSEIIDNYLIGKDPLDIERHWQAMYRGRHFRGGPVLMSAIGGIDQALWDIKGKHYGAPVYDLLGGRARDRIQVYQWIGGDTPAAVADAAVTAVENGYNTLKMAPIGQFRRIDSPEAVRKACERVAAVRDAVGDGIDIAVDFRGRVTKGMAKWTAAEMDEYDPMFYEEPLLPEHADSLPDIAGHSKTPLASGERLYSRWEFKHMLDEGLVDIVQPDPSHAGGISETKKIANTAEAADIQVALHCPLGPIAFASCVQLDMAVHNTIAQAQNLDIHAPADNEHLAYLEDPDVFGFDNGYVTAPDAPGLGIDMDESQVRERSQTGLEWQNPIWYHHDGSVAEW